MRQKSTKETDGTGMNRARTGTGRYPKSLLVAVILTVKSIYIQMQCMVTLRCLQMAPVESSKRVEALSGRLVPSASI